MKSNSAEELFAFKFMRKENKCKTPAKKGIPCAKGERHGLTMVSATAPETSSWRAPRIRRTARATPRQRRSPKGPASAPQSPGTAPTHPWPQAASIQPDGTSVEGSLESQSGMTKGGPWPLMAFLYWSFTKPTQWSNSARSLRWLA